MKKTILFLVLVLTTYTCFAEGHITFKGIEIDGSLLEFTQKLEEKGFTKVYTADDQSGCVLKGSFAGFDDCDVAVISTKNENIVWKVVVYLPDQTSWYALKSRYNDYKSSLIDKYGSPSNDFHFFSKPYYEGDGYELQALQNNKCHYAVYFQTTEGVICAEIGSAGYGKGNIQIKYEDAINSNLNSSNKKNAMIEDL